MGGNGRSFTGGDGVSVGQCTSEKPVERHEHIGPELLFCALLLAKALFWPFFGHFKESSYFY